MPSNKSADFQILTIWVHNERRDHNPNGGWATIRREPQTCFQEQGYKCEWPENGQVYFLFTRSSSVMEGDRIAWREGTGQKDEWVVTGINPTNQYVRCEVRRPRATDQSIDYLLRSASLNNAAEYMSNARQRLDEGTDTGWSDCVANCRNALQEVISALTGERNLSEGLRKLKDFCNLGEKEAEYIKSMERLFLASRDVLSKSGAHPPMPGQQFAIFALGLTTETLRFILTTRKQQS